MAQPKILIVDDSRTVRVRLQRTLSDAGYEVFLASDGAEAIQQVQVLQPDVIVLDIQMPDKDGYAVCQELKQMGHPWDELPVIFLTSLQSHALDLLGDEMGAYLRKPVQPDVLLKAVANLFAASGPNSSRVNAVSTEATARGQ